jgi:tetrahydromethanopterin S-methyltransferase subunit G
MATDVTREEFEARTGVLEREVEGEKLVTRHILEQPRRNGDDLAAVQTRLDRIEEKLDSVDLEGLVRKLDGLDRKVDGLAENLPRIVGDVMREVLRERDDKR